MVKIQKILIIRFGAIGDVVHSSALYRSLKEKNKNIEIHYATFKIPSMMIANDPDINKLWIIENKQYKSLYKIGKQLRKENFDLCINLQNSNRAKFLNFIVGAKKTLTYKKNFKFHAVENFWITALPVFKDLTLPTELKAYLPESTKEYINNNIDNNKNNICFNIGLSVVRQGRKWPDEYWIELAQKLSKDENKQIILVGTQEDIELAEKIQEAVPEAKSFCGKTSITESAALMSACDVVISADTGPLHIATAVGVKTIGLYGAAPIARTGPYGELANAVSSESKKCVPCNRRKCKYQKQGELYSPCMMDITPESILNLINELI